MFLSVVQQVADSCGSISNECELWSALDLDLMHFLGVDVYVRYICSNCKSHFFCDPVIPPDTNGKEKIVFLDKHISIGCPEHAQHSQVQVFSVINPSLCHERIYRRYPEMCIELPYSWLPCCEFRPLPDKAMAFLERSSNWKKSSHWSSHSAGHHDNFLRTFLLNGFIIMDLLLFVKREIYDHRTRFSRSGIVICILDN